MSHILELLEPFSAAIAATASLGLAVVVSGHAVLTRRDGRSAIGWVGLVWLVPIMGSLLYVGFGINRIRRRATAMRVRSGHGDGAAAWLAQLEGAAADRLGPAGAAALGNSSAALRNDPLVVLGDQLTHAPLTAGNLVAPLRDGDEAYPQMLEAIAQAQRSVTLSSYLFDHDAVGLRFVAALVAAHERGVQVRVLVDAVGARYSWPRAATLDLLAARGVPARRFNPTRSPIRLRYLNLRNHRKVLVLDGEVAFTGGMNIRADHVLADEPAHPTRDLHFRMSGPVVAQLQQSFAEDWWFSTGEQLNDAIWWPARNASKATIAAEGATFARAILDGPDEDLDKLRRIILGALSVARHRVCIATPYFLPDPDIVAALDVAALRGVQVDVLLPERSNLTLVQWAMTHHLWRILACGCAVWLAPAPFDHSKLMVVDERWALVGSGNWDPRSLRLNFELNVELHDAVLATKLTAIFDEKRARATRVSREMLAAAPLWARVRDGFAALGTPYL